MDVRPTATGPAINRDDPGQAGLAQESPLEQPGNARLRNTLQQSLSVGRASKGAVELPGFRVLIMSATLRERCERYRKELDAALNDVEDLQNEVQEYRSCNLRLEQRYKRVDCQLRYTKLALKGERSAVQRARQKFAAIDRQRALVPTAMASALTKMRDALVAVTARAASCTAVEAADVAGEQQASAGAVQGPSKDAPSSKEGPASAQSLSSITGARGLFPDRTPPMSSISRLRSGTPKPTRRGGRRAQHRS